MYYEIQYFENSEMHIFSHFNNSNPSKQQQVRLKGRTIPISLKTPKVPLLGHIPLSYLPGVATIFIFIVIIPFPFTIIVFYMFVYVSLQICFMCLRFYDCYCTIDNLSISFNLVSKIYQCHIWFHRFHYCSVFHYMNMPNLSIFYWGYLGCCHLFFATMNNTTANLLLHVKTYWFVENGVLGIITCIMCAIKIF